LRAGRPVLLAAHMDHPGFITRGMIDRNRLRADFHGWVCASYFAGEKVRFFRNGAWIRGRILTVEQSAPRSHREQRARTSAAAFRDQHPPESVVVRVQGTVPRGAIGMWDFPDARFRGHVLSARACDDVAGLAAVLCALDVICRRRMRSPCDAFFTRAEEVGFGGALAALNAGSIPRNALIVAVECSKAVTGVAHGAGPVLRVGDKASIFTPAATAYCQAVAEELAAHDKSFRFQRKLMDGGTCEATAYCHCGHDATGLCLPLGNYHNMDEKRRRIGPEFIDLRDFENLVKWFVALAESPARRRLDGSHQGLEQRLNAMLRQHRRRLLQTAVRVVAGAVPIDA